MSNITLLTYSNVLQLPANLIVQTIPLTNERFATFAFGFYDNMKANHSSEHPITYFGQTLGNLAKKLHCQLNDLFTNEKNQSLWTLKIFPITSNANESFEKTLQLIVSNEHLSTKYEYISIEEILKHRDITLTIQYRSNIINCT